MALSDSLLDTNVLSELVRPVPAPRVLAWVARCNPTSLYLSAVTLGKLTRGVSKLPAGRRRSQLTRWLDDDLLRQFAGRVLPFDDRAATCWGRLMADSDRKGLPRAALDAQIAATALRYELRLVTRNTIDFQGTGVTIVNPWLETR